MLSAGIAQPCLAGNGAAFRAGAGKATVSFEGLRWPVDGFTGLHDAPQVRVLLMEQEGARYAIVVMDLTSIDDALVTAAKSELTALAGVPAEHCRVCASHTFSVPHVFPASHLPDGTDAAQNSLLLTRYTRALQTAAGMAAGRLQPARTGAGSGESHISVNRDQHYPDGWWLGVDRDGYSDPGLGVLRIDDLAGKPLAVVFNYSVQPSVTEGAVSGNNGLQISSDLAGATSRYIEQHTGNDTVALFLVGAAGDQAPVDKAVRENVLPGGQVTRQVNSDSAWRLLSQLSQRLGADTVALLQSIRTREPAGLRVHRQTLQLPGLNYSPQHGPVGPVTRYNYPAGSQTALPVSYMVLGDLVWIGLQPELSARTGAEIRRQSPFRVTLISTLVDGGDKYLPDALSYDRMTYEARSSFYARGGAELASQAIIKTLYQLKDQERF